MADAVVEALRVGIAADFGTEVLWHGRKAHETLSEVSSTVGINDKYTVVERQR